MIGGGDMDSYAGEGARATWAWFSLQYEHV